MSNQQPTNCPNRSQAGFTLIELAIAVAVVVIGVMGLFALISAGLNSSAQAVADTQSALFVDNVYHGIRAASTSAAEQGKVGVVVEWRRFWKEFDNGTRTLPVAVPSLWEGKDNPRGPSTPLEIVGDGSLQAIEFVNIPLHDSRINDSLNHALRYRIDVEFDGSIDPVSSLDNLRVSVTMHVWPGAFGDAKDEDALFFYSEFDNPGDL